MGSDIKRRIAIQFVDSQGMVEAGIDGGGLFKEFLTTYVLRLLINRFIFIRISKTTFDESYGLFKYTPDRLLYPSPVDTGDGECFQ
jgi:ubiquitin-protein ligase E3 C